MIGSSENQVSYNGNGLTTEFPYAFKVLEKTDLKLLLVSKDGTETVLTSDYYVDIEKKSVFYPGYSPGAEPPTSDRPPVLQDGERLVIYRDVPITQETALDEHWPYNEIESSLDKLTIIAQQLNDGVNRSFRVTPGTSKDVETMLPVEAGKTFRWSDDGKKLELTADPKFVYQVTVGMRNETEQLRNQASGFSANADNKASAAATSASNAAKSETNAEYWALYGENAVKDIHLSVQAADESEANAKASETNAKSYEASAKSSADTAIANANSATSSANTATIQAQSANASATRANNSETNAKTSETNARNSELEAIRQADRAEAYGSKGEVYDSSKTYSPADVVMVSNGNLYRCIVVSTGENPVGSSKWVPVSMVDFLVFEADENGDLMPRLTPVTATNEGWETDVNGDIMPVA